MLSLLDTGGMGEVYRARDTRLDRLVALKTLVPSHRASREQLERFKREARAISRVNHPHICALYDIGEADGIDYLVMELLEGETLAALVSRGPVPLTRAVALAAEIADALDVAHRHGVIHRDLKPSNVMLTKVGVKLLDFGLAKLRTPELDADAQEPTRSVPLTEQDTVPGTLPYMAPEQIEGRDVDARTDIFALGIILYEMATGRRPFRGPSHASLAAAILTHDPPPVSAHAPLAPISLDRIVRTCLAKDPDDRWQSARDLASELRWIERDAAGGAGPTSRAQRRRERVRLLAVAGASIVATALAMWALAPHGATVSAGVRPQRWIPLTFRAGTISAARFAADGQTVVYSAAWGTQPYTLFMARQGSAESRALQVSDARLLGFSPSGELAFVRGTHSALTPFDAGGGTLARVPLTGGGSREMLEGVLTADWTARGDDLAIVRRGQVEWPIGHRIYAATAPLRYLRVAPGDDRLALFEGGSVIVLDRTGKKTTLATGLIQQGGLAWSPDGTEIWFSGIRDYMEPAVRAVSLSGTERVLLHSVAAPMIVQDVFRDGRALIVSHQRQHGMSCVPPGETRPRELGWLDFSSPEALSADGRTVVFGEILTAKGSQPAAYLRHTDGADAIRLGDGYPEDLSPDGRSVLVAIRAPGPPHWVILPTGPGESRSVPAQGFRALYEANFLPDGKRIAFGAAEPGRGRRIYVQDLAGGAPRAISPEGVWTSALATPDGRFVVGGSPDGHTLYPVDGGAPRLLPALSAEDQPLTWAPGGLALFVRRGDSWPPIVDRVDLVSNQRKPWQVVGPADPVGVDMMTRVLITPDGKSHCHDYVRWLSRLFIVEGIE